MCVWSLRVVVSPPVFDEAARLGQCDEQVFVQALVAEPADEAFRKRILCGFPRCDVVPLDLGVLRSLQDRMARQFRAVVGNEVQAPSFVRPGRYRNRFSRAYSPLASPSSLHSQPVFPVEPEQLLVIDLEAFAPQQNAQTPVAEPAALAGELSQPLP